MGDRTITRPHKKKRGRKFMPRGFEPTIIPVFERFKTAWDFDREVTNCLSFKADSI